MRRIKMSIPWIAILMSHLPVLLLFLYLSYFANGGIFHQTTHACIIALNCVFMGGWLLAGKFKPIKNSYQIFAILILVTSSVGMCALATGFWKVKLVTMTLNLVLSALFLFVHLMNKVKTDL